MTTNEKATILIVDDTPVNIRVLAAALETEYDIRIARDGSAALELLLNGPMLPDLILLDIMMPGVDGYEVCRRIKEVESLKHIPVIFITAMGEDEDESRGLKLGAVDYITKPFRPAIVALRVQNHLELKRQRDILERLSLTDSLTGIPNRLFFDECLEKEWKRVLRNNSCLSLVMMDIDHFKAYNDNYGHQAGDVCLREIAGELHATAIRAGDFFARYGGEEFACILPETESSGAEYIAVSMMTRVAALKIPHAFSSVVPYVTLSIGIATTVPCQGTLPGGLIEMADKMLYEAKAKGRNRIERATL
ncbi:MAG: diguanylate cyclase [Pseudomonadota bacterium]